MAVKVELSVVVENWEATTRGDEGKRRYNVAQRFWQKSVEVPAPLCEGQTVAPSLYASPRVVEAVYYNLDTETFEVDLERYRYLSSIAVDVEQELEDDGWVISSWDGDFGE